MRNLEETELPAEALSLMKQARRIETPCGDGNMVWRTWGDGPPVLLLHGGSGSWSHWLRNIQALVDGRHLVIAPDLPGLGESAVPPGKPDADTCVAPVLAGLEQVLAGQAVDVAGFSFGSLVATLAAVRSPSRFRRIALLGAPILPLNRARGLPMRSWRELDTREERREAHRHNLGVMMIHRPDAIDDTAVALQGHYVPMDRILERKLVTTDTMRRALQQVTRPIWAVYGSEDVVFSHHWPEIEAAWREVPQLQEFTRFPEIGHWVQYESAEAVNQLLLRVFA